LLQLSGHKQQFFCRFICNKAGNKRLQTITTKNLVLIATKLNYNKITLQLFHSFFYNKLKKAFQQTNLTNSTNIPLIIAKSNNQHYNFSVHNFLQQIKKKLSTTIANNFNKIN
jgi:hypothetical protein